MELGEAPADTAIQVTCPHCGQTDVDDLELLAPDEMHALACEACTRRFHLAIYECAHCGDETVCAWPAVPTPAQIRMASCRHCGHLLHGDEQDPRSLDGA